MSAASKHDIDRYIDPDAWLAQTTPVNGSWWQDWVRWLAARSGQAAAPPNRGAPDRSLPALPDVPGAYVLGR